jgi:NAD(P)-dependent dehydrogenase (short-subunit alcohol dehydrogenase family)
MASQMPFKGKVIAITGAASGMGLELAHYLAARGATLSLGDVQEKALATARDSIYTLSPEARVLIKVMDVRNHKEVDDWIAATVKEFGSLSGAANLAGVVGRSVGKPAGGIKGLEDKEWKFILDVNLTGVFNCLRAQLKVIEKGGSIVNAASVAGLVGSPQNAAYSASKHGVVGLTRSAAKEEGGSGVRVNCICPSVFALFHIYPVLTCRKRDD